MGTFTDSSASDGEMGVSGKFEEQIARGVLPEQEAWPGICGQRAELLAHVVDEVQALADTAEDPVERYNLEQIRDRLAVMIGDSKRRDQTIKN